MLGQFCAAKIEYHRLGIMRSNRNLLDLWLVKGGQYKIKGPQLVRAALLLITWQGISHGMSRGREKGTEREKGGGRVV